MSFLFGRPRMIHAGVNTDPLQWTWENRQNYYGLSSREIPYLRISDGKDINQWFEVRKIIGQGAFSVVLAVQEKSTLKKFAMKTVSKNNMERLSLFKREIQILRLIQHPHIIFLNKVYESPRKIFMIFECCKGDFFQLYIKRKPFQEDIARRILFDIVDAVAYLHKHDIVHRDLKMENILLGENPEDADDEYYIKISDFGLSVVKSSGMNSMLHDFCGTPHYMAPEMIQFKSYNQQCDIWAMGVILFMLVMGKYPFYADNRAELNSLICKHKIELIHTALSPEIQDLIFLLLIKDPLHRIRATEILQHPWILNEHLAKNKESNILKIMKEWKSEMTVPTGKESDWVSPPAVHLEAKFEKLPMKLPKTNITFDRYKREAYKSKKLNPKNSKN